MSRHFVSTSGPSLQGAGNTALPENLVLNIFFFLDVEGSDQW